MGQKFPRGQGGCPIQNDHRVVPREDRHNFDTFGEVAGPGGGAWDFDAMLEVSAANVPVVCATLCSAAKQRPNAFCVLARLTAH
eukprot:6215448-Amphidinium_carterae.2